MTRGFLRSTLLWAAASAVAVTAAGCAARTLRLPTGAGAPVADAAGTLDAATGGCRAVRTLQAELSVSGLAGGEKIRGRVIAGFERPSAMRLEAVAPFGAPVFILVARAGSATLLMPRDARMLADAPPADVIEALTGVSLAPDDLLAVLAGCASNDRQAVSARAYDHKWVRMDLADGTALYLRPQSGGWRIAAATRGSLTIEYGHGPGTTPSRVHLRVTSGANVVAADLDIRLAQVETNTSIDPRAFALRVPDRTVPLTLDELRRSGPLGPRR